MILQHTYGFTATDNDMVIPEELNAIFRVGCSENTSTSATGESAYLSFNANETKTIAVPLGYSSANRLRFVGTTNGTLQLTITHPTLGPQVLTIKQGSIALTMRISGISIQEMAGSSAYFKWSIMQTEATSTEVFS